MPRHPLYSNLTFKRLIDVIVRPSDPGARKEAAHRELDLVLQAVEPIQRKRPGQSPPNVSGEVAAVVGPILMKALRCGDLLKLNVSELRERKPDQAVTSQMLRAALEWKGLRLNKVVVDVENIIAKRLCDLEEKLETLHPVKDKMQIGEIKKEIMRLEKIPGGDRLTKYVRDEILVLTIALDWEEMPPCLVDRRQKWLGTGDCLDSFYRRTDTLMMSLENYPENEMCDRFEWLKYICCLKSYALNADDTIFSNLPWYYSIPSGNVQNPARIPTN